MSGCLGDLPPTDRLTDQGETDIHTDRQTDRQTDRPQLATVGKTWKHAHTLIHSYTHTPIHPYTHSSLSVCQSVSLQSVHPGDSGATRDARDARDPRERLLIYLCSAG
jgi:hypothetical protein